VNYDLSGAAAAIAPADQRFVYQMGVPAARNSSHSAAWKSKP
jgi:hypothetical protein